MFKFAERPLSISAVYGQSFKFYKDVFAKVWYWVAVNMIIMGVIHFVTARYVPIDDKLVASTLSRTQLLIFMAANFLTFVIAVYFIALVMYRMSVLAGGSTISNSNSCREVFRKWFDLSVTKLMIVIILLLGALFFVLPSIFCGVFLAFCIPAILFEDKGPIGSIKRSCQLVWLNWWRTFTVLIPVGVILGIGTLGEGVLHGVIKNGLLVYVITALFFAIFAVLVYAFILVQYNDLKLRRSGISVNN